MNEHELLTESEPSHAEALAPDAPAVDESLSAYVREEIERRFQSAKDKRWAELERQYGALAAFGQALAAAMLAYKLLAGE